jgi:hypothetical protein
MLIFFSHSIYHIIIALLVFSQNNNNNIDKILTIKYKRRDSDSIPGWKQFFCQTLLILWLNSGLLESPSPKNQRIRNQKKN